MASAAEAPAPQPTARTGALSNADPVWSNVLMLMLAAGAVRPPLVRVEVWSSSTGDGGEAQEDALLGSSAVRLADAERGKVRLELAPESRLPSFRISFVFDMCRALPRCLSLSNIAVRGRPSLTASPKMLPCYTSLPSVLHPCCSWYLAWA